MGVAVALAGCTALDEAGQALRDLAGGGEATARTVLLAAEACTTESALRNATKGPPGCSFARGFDVPRGAQFLDVDVNVTLEGPARPPLPQGNATVEILGPDATARFTYQSTSGLARHERIQDPTPGPWEVRVRIVGSGFYGASARVIERA